MKWRIGTLSLLIPFMFTLTSCGESKEKPSPEEEAEINVNMKQEAEVRSQAQKYIDAINTRDLEKIGSFWSPEAVYKNPITGDLVQGREGIKAEFAKISDHLKNGKVEFRIDTIRFPIEGKASENGVATLSIPGKEPIYSDFKMIHVKKDGQWLILHVSQLDFGMLAPNAPKNRKTE